MFLSNCVQSLDIYENPVILEQREQKFAFYIAPLTPVMVILVYRNILLRKVVSPTNTESLWTVSDVAKYLKVSMQHVRTLIRDGQLEADRVGKQWLTTEENVQEFIKAHDFIIEPDDHARLSEETPGIIGLSFFSGAMGLDIGMKNGGIDAMLACEFEKNCRTTIAVNNPDIALIGDIDKYSADEILKMAKVPEGRKVDIIFGGPPCQAFSTAGARKAFADDRGNVFLRFIDIIGEIKPTYVVIENVRGLLSAPYPYGNIEEPIKGGALLVILERLNKLGYAVSFELYNAANYGAPQIRERVVIIAKLGNEKMPYLKPTHSNDPKYNLSVWNTLKDAFDTLPEDVIHHHIDFPESRLKFYRILTEGQYWKNLPEELWEEAMGNSLKLGGGKTGFLRRLAYNKPSPTLVTNPTMPATDLCHPTEDRPLSVEEYGCIQGFPADWKICGPILEQYKQIGNAVPIKLGEAIARTIIADMKGEKIINDPEFRYSRYKNTSDVTWANHMKKVLAEHGDTEERPWL